MPALTCARSILGHSPLAPIRGLRDVAVGVIERTLASLKSERKPRKGLYGNWQGRVVSPWRREALLRQCVEVGSMLRRHETLVCATHGENVRGAYA